MKLKYFIILLSSLVFISFFNYRPVELNPAERMYSSILCYADSFEVPLYVAFNIATLETNYKGPLDSLYNHRQISKAGAMGPMQIMYKYAHSFAGRKVSKKELLDSIEFNVQLSMKILSNNYKKYKDWRKATGAYNTGRPIINSYAIKASDSTYFQKKWITPFQESKARTHLALD